MPPALDGVEQRPLGAGVWAFPADQESGALGPAGRVEQPGDFTGTAARSCCHDGRVDVQEQAVDLPAGDARLRQVTTDLGVLSPSDLTGHEPGRFVVQ